MDNVGQVQKQSPIGDRLDESDKLLSNLAEKVGELHAKLEPVIITEENKPPKSTGTVDVPRCPLERAIVDINNRLNDRIEELNKIMSELQI